MTEPSLHRSLAARSRSVLRVGLALALLFLLSLSPGVAQTVGAPPGDWVLTRHTVGLIAAADPALATGAIPAGTGAVMYDPEGWAATPRWEREDPAEYMKAFSELATAWDTPSS